MAHRNRWFTELKTGWIFHGYVSHNQMVSKFSGDAVIFFDGSTGFRHVDNNTWVLLGFKHPKIRFRQQKKG